MNLKSNKIYCDVTENVFCKKKLGIATITKEGALNYTRENFPANFQEIQKYYTKNGEDLILDFENIFTAMEHSYKIPLEDLILSNKIIGVAEKSQLAVFILFQTLRNPKSINDLLKINSFQNMEKFELLVSIKHKISNTNELLQMITPILTHSWTLFKLEQNTFPLSDNPILSNKGNLMVSIAPNIMLEIDFNRNCDVTEPVIVKSTIANRRKRDFIYRTIRNSTQEIIFGDEKLLNQIKNSAQYKSHLNQLNNAC